MDASLYDEFGNYLGPELKEEEEEEDVGAGEQEEDVWADEDDDEAMRGAAGGAAAGASTDIIQHSGAAGAASASAIVLHEDKKYYPDAAEVYPEAEVLVQDEDAQPLSQPMVAPMKTTTFSALETEPPTTTYSAAFLTSLLSVPSLMRNVAVVGHLHHGKTSVVDMMIHRTLAAPWDPAAPLPRYTDARADEQARALSIKSTPVSLVLQATGTDKSYLLNLVDTPGHVNFCDEVTAAYRACDGVMLVVDAVEGLMLGAQRSIAQAVRERLPIMLVINKVDRLIIELKLPPTDAYIKLLHIITEVNAAITDAAAALPPPKPVLASSAAAAGGVPPPPSYTPTELSPAAGNVVFASATHGWSFSLLSFASAYIETRKKLAGGATAALAAVAPAELAKRLWGDLYFDAAGSRRFKRSPPTGDVPRSFVAFILNPLYKVYAHVLGAEADALAGTLADIGVRLRKSELHLDPSPLLRLVMGRWMGSTSGIVDACVAHLPNPVVGGAAKAAYAYTGLQDSPEAAAMRAGDPAGILMVNVVKMYPTPDASAFLALGRVVSGTLKAGDAVKVMGEGYSADDEEDVAIRSVTGISIGQARYRTEITSAPPGALVLIGGVDDVIAKTATITGTGDDALRVAIFAPLKHTTSAVVTVSVEPLNPSELPKVLEGIRKVTKTYPLARSKVEESGEHVLVGTGELGLDCMLHDLRLMFSGVEVKVSDPVVTFAETVSESSSITCFAASANKHNKLSMLAQPLDAGLAADIEAEAVSLHWERKRVAEFFTTKYDWDLLAARGVWAFGPTETGPNVLLDDTLSSDVDKAALRTIKDGVVQGFQWACREGPLAEEPIRNVKYRILDATIAREPLHRGSGQITPAARRVVYSSFLLASPRMLEPVYRVEILAPADAIQAIYAVLARRRGHITSDAPRPGTPFYVVNAFLPVIDSFGFETDLRVHTQGQAFGLQVFDHWAVVPGDPLDKTVILRPLEPSPPAALAREFMIKTRRRKGLSEDVSINKFFDADLLAYLAAQQAEAAEADAAAVAAAAGGAGRLTGGAGAAGGAAAGRY